MSNLTCRLKLVPRKGENLVGPEGRKGFFPTKQRRLAVDQIISKLRTADVEFGQGKKIPEVCKEPESLAGNRDGTGGAIPSVFVGKVH